MDREGKILRLGVAVILCAVLFRLAGEGNRYFKRERLLELMFFWQTGFRVEQTQPTQPEITYDPTQPSAQPAIAPQPLLPLQLTREDLARVQLQNGTEYPVDVAALLEKPLQWDLQGDEPAVLILHTHATESYTQTEVYQESAAYRTLDENFNMVSIGAELAACLVLDLHRDAMEGSDGSQLGYTQQTREGVAAKMMVVCGSDAGGLNYPNWQENLSLGLKLQAALEAQCPGLCRPLSLRTGRYNQDLMRNMLLIEVGAAGNTRQQALIAVRELARAVVDMAHGVQISRG